MRAGKAVGSDLMEGLVEKLEEAYVAAGALYTEGHEPKWGLSSRFLSALGAMSEASSQASSAFTNIVTCLAIKALKPELDVRIHQVQIGAPFSFRNLSEKVIYPWLSGKDFEGAKSGWQTRTFERPKPYTMDFAENIGSIKEPFLTCFDEIQVNGGSPLLALTFLFYRQLEKREKKKIPLATPNIDDIETMVGFFDRHFSAKYGSKGASRLPVLAIYAIYSVMMRQLKRYDGKVLRKLQNHAAADAQTGAVGDIEVESANGSLFEGVEIKHNIPITEDMIKDIAKKIAPHSPNRYYVLTTHRICQPSEEMSVLIQQVKRQIGSQVIVNGVIPTIRYYLRLLADPSEVFPLYTSLMMEDAAISHEHRIAWNDIVTGKTS